MNLIADACNVSRERVNSVSRGFSNCTILEFLEMGFLVASAFKRCCQHHGSVHPGEDSDTQTFGVARALC